MFADPSAFADLSVSANTFAFAGPIFPSPFAGLLLLVILNMTKPFNIGKSVTSVNNITIAKILKDIIWIARVLFLSLYKTWQYMLGIPDHDHQLEVTEDITY